MVRQSHHERLKVPDHRRIALGIDVRNVFIVTASLDGKTKTRRKIFIVRQFHMGSPFLSGHYF
jgi:hypothetical protein